MQKGKWFFALALSVVAMAAGEEGTIRAKVLPPDQRKAAVEFRLQDTAGTTATMAGYQGKVLLLDFWATWCGGCKHEIPWFEEFNTRYSAKGLAVLGVSLDDDGWKVLKPFLAEHPISYRVVLGDEATAKLYSIAGMPDTFLIDKQGRLAAAYRAGVVDQEDMEANIRVLLAEK